MSEKFTARALMRHGALNCFQFLRRQRHRGLASFELLHVDPRIVSALDRAHDEPAPAPVQQGDRGRLVPAYVLVRVVADYRAVGDAAVDAAVDARKPLSLSQSPRTASRATPARPPTPIAIHPAVELEKFTR